MIQREDKMLRRNKEKREKGNRLFKKKIARAVACFSAFMRLNIVVFKFEFSQN